MLCAGENGQVKGALRHLSVMDRFRHHFQPERVADDQDAVGIFQDRQRRFEQRRACRPRGDQQIGIDGGTPSTHQTDHHGGGGPLR